MISTLLMNSSHTQKMEQSNSNWENQINIQIIYPTNNETLIITNKPFYIFGNVNLLNAKLKINGVEAQIDDDGAFIAFTPIIKMNENQGKFVFELSINGTKKIIEKIYNIKIPPETSPEDSLIIDNDWESIPSQNISLQKGDLLQVEIKATPNANVSFSISGINKNFPMVESEQINYYLHADAIFGDGFIGIWESIPSGKDTIKGIYHGALKIHKDLDNADISVTVSKKNLGTIKKKLSRKITILNDEIPLVVQTKYDPNKIIGRYGPTLGYNLFLDEGIKLEVVGKFGNWLKTKLANTDFLYIPDTSVNELPAGTPPTDASIFIIRTKDNHNYVNVEFGFSEKVPYKIIQHNNPQMIEFIAYNVTSNIDWIFYDKQSEFIKGIKWDQPFEKVLNVKIYLNQKTHWGYSIEYRNNVLNLKINKPAKRNSQFLFWNNQLNNRKIVLDPGHSPDLGAVGPRGTKEKDVNLQITLKLKKMLEDKGAKVNLTHSGEGISLRERKGKVNSFSPEISISIHNNAVPDGVDPIKHNGSSVYYYYPQAKPLAEFIHKNFLNNLGLKNFGFYWDNLYMCRIPESISLLVEPAFMMLPEQEKLLLTDDFQNKIAKSIFDAINKFYEENTE